MIRLYAGLVKGNTWYNHVKVNPLKGGAIALIKGADKSGAARLLNLVKSTVPCVYTESGEEIQLNETDYLSLRYADAWKIALEYVKDFSSSQTFKEFFFCDRCSSVGNERYTEVEESWRGLIEAGHLQETYLDEPVFSWEVELPEGFEIAANNAFKGGVFTKATLRFLTMGDMLKISNLPDIKLDESVLLAAVIDSQLVGFEGMDQKTFNAYVGRSLRDSFTRQYITSLDDQTTLLQSKEIGLNADKRYVSCTYCHNEIGGGLDFTNFFSAILVAKSSQKSSMAAKSIQGLA